MTLKIKNQTTFSVKKKFNMLCHLLGLNLPYLSSKRKSAKRLCVKYIGPGELMITRMYDHVNLLVRRLKIIINGGRCDVLLINPPHFGWEHLMIRHNVPQNLTQKIYAACKLGYTIKLDLEEPLGLASIAAYLQKNKFDVRIIDVQIERVTNKMLCSLIKDLKPKIVGISGITRQANFAYKTGQLIRSKFPSTYLVYGGVHASIFFKEPFEKGCADFVVIGEGEETMLELCTALIKTKNEFSRIKGLAYKNNRRIMLTEVRPLIKDINQLPFPSSDLLPVQKYCTSIHIKPFYKKQAMSIMASRGCINNCGYCSIPSIWQRKLRMIDPKNIVQRIKKAVKEQGVDCFHFYDDDFLSDAEFVKKFCSLLEENDIKINWVIQGCVSSIIKNRNLIPRLKEMGCVAIELGIESCDNSVLKNLNKSQSVRSIVLANNILKKAGIVPVYLIMAFCPGETIDSVYNSAQLVNKIFGDTHHDVIEEVHKYASFPLFHGLFFTPIPGSALFNRAEENGVVFAKKWDHFFFTRVNFIPKEFLNDIPGKRMTMQKNDFLSVMADYKPQFLYYFKNFRGMIFNKGLDEYLGYLNSIYDLCDGKKSAKEVIDKTLKEYPQTSFEQGALSVRFLAMFGLIKSQVK